MKNLLILLVLSIVFIATACSDDSECKDQCTNAETRCTSDKKAVEVCELQDNSCTIWVKTACTDNKTCGTKVVENKTSYECMDDSSTTCTEGDKQCNADNVETCKADGTWEITTTCTAPEKCNATDYTCKAEASTCTGGDQRCNENNVETCKADGSEWEVTTTCAASQTCDATNYTCKEGSTGCTTNGDCALSEICSSNACVTIADGDDCTMEQHAKTRCADASTLLVCTLQADATSYKWEETDCSTSSCVTDPSSHVDGCAAK